MDDDILKDDISSKIFSRFGDVANKKRNFRGDQLMSYAGFQNEIQFSSKFILIQSFMFVVFVLDEINLPH